MQNLYIYSEKGEYMIMNNECKEECVSISNIHEFYKKGGFVGRLLHVLRALLLCKNSSEEVAIK